MQVIVEYSFLFLMVKTYKNRPRNARVIVENKVALRVQLLSSRALDFVIIRSWVRFTLGQLEHSHLCASVTMHYNLVLVE